jgi:hypothetical protein
MKHDSFPLLPYHASSGRPYFQKQIALTAGFVGSAKQKDAR